MPAQEQVILLTAPRLRSLFAALGVIIFLLASASSAAASSAAAPDVRAEIECLALNIYFEARGETDLGKRAVGHVVLNRVSDPKFPDTICNVIRQGGSKVRWRCQFSWWCDGQSDRPEEMHAWERSKAIARTVYWGESVDPTSGALWYHADSVFPSWRTKLIRGPAIDNHIFYLRELLPWMPRATGKL